MNASTLKRRAIYVTKHGSHAYDLNTPTSDLDVKGVFVGEERHYLGYLLRVEQVEEKQPNDFVLYEATKFFRLAADCNPNIIEVLWTDPKDVLYINHWGTKLLDIRQQFLSQKAKFTFTGYAAAQLKRMVNHHEWMKNPPKPPLSRSEAGLPPNKNWCAHIDLAWEKNAKDGMTQIEITAQEGSAYAKELEWRNASKRWAHYQEWLAGRNPVRHELEVKFGYDTKHGMHLVRLMRMGEEILKTGKVNVKRADREELLAIRNKGIWSYEEIVDWSKKKEAELDDFYKSGLSPLPKEPNREVLDEHCRTLIATMLHDEYKHMSWGSAWTWFKPWNGEV